MEIPSDRRYSETHEWFRASNDVVTVGISQFAADELTDITYVALPEVGRTVAPGEACAEIESVKATAEIYCAVGGEIVEINSQLADRPELLNEDAFDTGWIFKIKCPDLSPLDELMTAAEYERHIAD